MTKQARRIDQLCDAYEQAWRQGPPLSFGQYLADCSEPLTAPLLKELACLDLELRRSRGETPDIERYLRHVPEHVEPAAILIGLVQHEVELRQQRGEVVRISEYYARFPECESQIRDSYPVTLSTSIENLESPTEQFPDTVLLTHQTGRRRPGGGLPGLVREILTDAADFQDYAAGDFIIREGDTEQDLYLIKAGAVQAVLRDDSGGEVVLGEAEPGDVVGEMALLSTEPRTSNIIAATAVTAGKIAAADFHQMAGDYPQLAAMLTDIVAERLGRSDRDALSGQILCGHRIERMLGKGANGIVYAARETDTSTLVALKMMSHRLVYSPRARELFRHEAETVKRMDHPNIIRLRSTFDAFHTCFIVFDYVQGQTLADTLKNGRLEPSAVERILTDVSAALSYAHSLGIIHRDVKPGNIMILPDGHARLMDFGLAASQTTAGEICGTPRYMSPEQRRGADVTSAADWFSLGAVGFEMLTGQRLFDGNVQEELYRDFQDWRVPEDTIAETDIGQTILAMLRVDPAQRTGYLGD